MGIDFDLDEHDVFQKRKIKARGNEKDEKGIRNENRGSSKRG